MPQRLILKAVRLVAFLVCMVGQKTFLFPHAYYEEIENIHTLPVFQVVAQIYRNYYIHNYDFSLMYGTLNLRYGN